MPQQQVVIFNVDGFRVVVPLAEAAELSDRLHTQSGDDPEHPAYSATVLVDRAIEGAATEELEWHTPEKDALRGAIEEWLDEVGAAAIPEPIMTLRYALFGEWQDETPGSYLLVLEDPTGVRDVPRDFDRPPVPGQALEIDGKTYVLGSAIPSPGTPYLAVVRAIPHAG